MTQAKLRVQPIYKIIQKSVYSVNTVIVKVYVY